MREIEQEKLEEILQNHKLWLETRDFDEIKGERANLRGANLRIADLRIADLQGADLRGADLDFASLPLRCGGLKWKLDKRLMVQFLYHFCSHECEDKEIKEAQNYLLPLANQFHRVGDDCQKLEPKEIPEE